MHNNDESERKRTQLATATRGLILLALILAVIRVVAQVLLTAGVL